MTQRGFQFGGLAFPIPLNIHSARKRISMMILYMKVQRVLYLHNRGPMKTPKSTQAKQSHLFGSFLPTKSLKQSQSTPLLETAGSVNVVQVPEGFLQTLPCRSFPKATAKIWKIDNGFGCTTALLTVLSTLCMRRGLCLEILSCCNCLPRTITPPHPNGKDYPPPILLHRRYTRFFFHVHMSSQTDFPNLVRQTKEITFAGAPWLGGLGFGVDSIFGLGQGLWGLLWPPPLFPPSNIL